MWLVDHAGRRYLDFAGGIAVVGLGHRHPAPLAAAHAQLDKLWHSSNLYGSEPAPVLARRLSERFGGAQAFFCNSGAEANEAALKYARKATGKPGVIALEQSFHGRTTGSLSVTGQPAKRAAFEPLMPGARFAQPNDVDSLRAAASDDVGLVLLEPVLGEGGVIPLEPAVPRRRGGARRRARRAARVRRGADRDGPHRQLLRVRAARRAAAARHAREGARERPADRLPARRRRSGRRVRSPATTARRSAATPSSCAAAVAVCDAIDDELLAAGARERRTAAGGSRLAAGCGRRARRGPARRRRARRARCSRLVDAALDAGLVCLTSGPNVLRLAPPLVVERRRRRPRARDPRRR